MGREDDVRGRIWPDVDDLARTARVTEDVELMYRVGWMHELAGNRRTGREWFEAAGQRCHVPALHELARLDVEEGELAAARTRLARVGEVLSARPPDSIATGPVRPPSVPPHHRQGRSPLTSPDTEWGTSHGWVSVAPAVFGVDPAGRPIDFDGTGDSLRAPSFRIVTPSPELVATLMYAVRARMYAVDRSGRLLTEPEVAAGTGDNPHFVHDPGVGPHAVVMTVDVGGRLPVPMGRSFVQLIAAPLIEHRIPAHIAGSPVAA